MSGGRVCVCETRLGGAEARGNLSCGLDGCGGFAFGQAGCAGRITVYSVCEGGTGLARLGGEGAQWESG